MVDAESCMEGPEGVRGVLPLSMLATLLVANMSGVWINNKMHWIVTAYALSSLYVGSQGKRVFLKNNLNTEENGVVAL